MDNTFAISEEELRELICGNGPIPLPQSASCTAPRHNVAPPSNQTDTFSLPNRLLLPTTTTRDVRNAGPSTQTIPSSSSSSSHTPSSSTYHSTTSLSIRLLKPRPNQGGVVLLTRIETHVYLDIKLPSQSWNAIQLLWTNSVTSDESCSIGKEVRPLLLLIIVRGATTRQPCDHVCEQCERRIGQRIGPPSLLDFHSSSNIIRAKDGRARVHFKFCCYSRHHQKEDEQYTLEVILRDISNPSQPIEVARKELPYYFDVRSSKPRIKEPTSDQTQQASTDASSEIRRGTNHPSATPSPPPSASAQLESEQQSPSYVQHLPPAIPVFHPSGAPNPPLVQDAQPRRGSSGGKDMDSLEGDQASALTMRSENSAFGINVPRTSSTSNNGAQGISHGGIRKGHSYDIPSTLGQQKPAPFALAYHPSIQPPRILTNTEKLQTRAKLSERQAQIKRFEMMIKDLRANFEAESQEKLAPLQSIVDHFDSQILVIQKELVNHWNVFSAERQKAEAAAMAKVTDLEVQIHALKQENSYAASVPAPIRRLPAEILAEIFLLTIHAHAQSPLNLILVCRSWHSVILKMPHNWPTIGLSTSTKPSKAGFILDQTRATLLDVEINTSTCTLKVVDGDKVTGYASLDMATKEVKKWRTLTITGFPHSTNIDACPLRVKSAFIFNGPMDALQSFKIKSICCEDCILLDQLLEVVGSSSHDELTDMEISSPYAMGRLAQPYFATIFHHLVTFKVKVREMRTEVDILTSLERLETLEAHHLRLPSYSLDTDLPLVRTLKRMKIKLASVQWMAGRIFPNMEECTIIRPFYPETLGPGGGVGLPICTQFTYDDHTIDVLPNFYIPKLDTLTIRNDAWNKGRGSTQLAAVWSGMASRATPLKPRVLHLDTLCYDQYLINALGVLPELEELYLGLVRPDGLGRMFFGALEAENGRGSHSPSATYAFGLCPNLRTFGIRYHHWIRHGERDEITPLLHRMIETRQRVGAPLQSVKFWAPKDILDEQAVELCQPTEMGRKS